MMMNRLTPRLRDLTLRGMIGLAAVAVLSCGAQSPSTRDRPNIFLIVLDTARADHLSLYGYPKDTTPNLVAFAEDAIRFDRAYSTSCWTLAAHASLFTGLLPITHQATQENLRLDQELDTLAELLAGAGYETAAFTNNSWISAATNLTQGFHTVEALWRNRETPEQDSLPHPTNEAVMTWLQKRRQQAPFFVFINFMEPHWPYGAPVVYQDRFAEPDLSQDVRRRSGFSAIRWYISGRRASPEVLRARTALYDAELAYLDNVLGHLFEKLNKLSLLEDALIVVTADHGENLGDHGHQGHSFVLYDSTLRIPLVIRPPGGRDGNTQRNDPVQLTDVFTTIATAAGITPTDDRITGNDLLAGPLPDDRLIVGEYYHPKTFLGRFPDTPKAKQAIAPYERRIRSIQVGSQKLIWGSDGHHELYDTGKDPDETRNRIRREPEEARRLEMWLDERMRHLSRPVSEPQQPLSEMDEETKANLRALGYLP
jgi:arylsulfatase A-like enzyme